MPAPLLATKLYFPLARSSLVSRPHLVERLNAGLSGPLTLISAPAGYGKTTLMSEWRAGIAAGYSLYGGNFGGASTAVAWLSLDANDNDLARFLSYMVAALKTLNPRLVKNTVSLLQSPQPMPSDVVLTALVNDINRYPQHFALVLDDYHAITNRTVHEAVTFLLDHLPPQMHLVILTRADPPLPLHRLRARRHMLEIRQDDLRFSAQEASVFLDQVMKIQLSQEDVEALTHRTEGWITGLQLAALSLRAHPDSHAFVQSFTGSSRYVLDYLFEEVFQQQAPETQSFLLATSILERLEPSLCNALTGRKDGSAQLEYLEKTNLFITPLEPDCRGALYRRYRYHHLFADLLLHLLHISSELSEVELHKRASRWYWNMNLTTDAIRHALMAEDWDLVAEQIEASSEALLNGGEITTLLSWFSKFPKEIVQVRPNLGLAYAWSLLLSGQLELARTILERVEQSSQGEPSLMGEIAATQAYLAFFQGDGRRLIELSHKALSLLSAKNLNARGLVALNLGMAYWHIGRLTEAQQALEEALHATRQTGNTYGEMMTSIFLGRIRASHGQLHQAAAWFQEIARKAEKMFAFPLPYLDLCALHYEWNDLEGAAQYLARGLEASLQSGNLEFQIAAYMLRARLRLAQGDPTGAQQSLEKASQVNRTSAIPLRMQARIADLQVQMALWNDDLEIASQLSPNLAPDTNSHPFYRFLGLTSSFLLLAQGRRVDASDQLTLAAQTAQRNGWGYGLVATRVLQTLAAETTHAALVFLEEALALAKPEGFIRTFADAGPAITPLLQEAARRGLQPEYIGQILAAIKGGRRHQVKHGELAEALSERELEVLRLMTTGLSNREIAAQLIVSLSTVKSHVHNLCGKLGVDNRIKAVTRARDLKLV